MPKIIIEGGRKLTGTIKVGGAKNSVVALIPAAILCDEKTTITNVTNIDVVFTCPCVKSIKVKVNDHSSIEFHFVCFHF